MITLHSINLRETKEPCFAKMLGGKCRVLAITPRDCGFACAFYKPKDCKDWVRIGDNLIPPEEYRRAK